MKDEVKDASTDNNYRDETKAQVQTQLSKKEIYSLKQARYNEKIDKFDTSYVIMNKKTGMIVEMKAMSPMHACTMIGWRVKNCKLMDIIKKEIVKAEEIKLVDDFYGKTKLLDNVDDAIDKMKQDRKNENIDIIEKDVIT